jgi:DNA-binding FadR family transcriptional regulator
VARLQLRSLPAQAAEQLEARIASGEWAVGARLPGETLLAAELGVARSTVREALRVLAAGGLVESRQGAGSFVLRRERSADWALAVLRADVEEVLEVRRAIEVQAAGLAALRRRPEDLARMRSALEARAAAAAGGTDDAYVDADLAVHRAIVRAGGNALLASLFEQIEPRVRTAMTGMLALGAGDAAYRADQHEHEALVAAIAAADADAATALAAAHFAAIGRRER